MLAADSLFFIPSSNRNRIWVAIPDRGPRKDGIVAAVRELTSGGKKTSRDVRPPGGAWPEGAVDAGLLFHRNGKRIVWDPVKRRVVHRLPSGDLGPTHRNRVAWCDDRCSTMRIRDVATGDEIAIGLPEGAESFRAWEGAFSRDGTTIGVPVQVSGDARTVRLALVDVASATAQVVPGTTTAMTYNFVAWDATGDHVFFTGADRDGDRTVAVYRIGDERAQVLRVDVGAFYDVAAI